MSISYINTRRDLLALSAITYARSPWSYVLLAVFTLATLPGTLDALDSGYGLFVNIVTAAIMQLALLGVLMCLAVPAIAAITLVAGKKSLTQHTITLTPESLTEQTQYDTTVSMWRGVHRVTRIGGYILVYLSPASAHIIPRRAVGTDEEWASLYAVLHGSWVQARA